MQRILGIVVGVLALAYGGWQIYKAISPSLPGCDSGETKDLLRQLAANIVGSKADPAKVKDAVVFNDITELSYDKDKELRECKMNFDLTLDGQSIAAKYPVNYAISWSNKSAREFLVQPHL